MVLYTISAVIAIVIILIRRYVGFFGKAELGGPKAGKWVSCVIFIALWLTYIILSSLQAYGVITTGF